MKTGKTRKLGQSRCPSGAILEWTRSYWLFVFVSQFASGLLRISTTIGQIDTLAAFFITAKNRDRVSAGAGALGGVPRD